MSIAASRQSQSFSSSIFKKKRGENKEQSTAKCVKEDFSWAILDDQPPISTLVDTSEVA